MSYCSCIVYARLYLRDIMWVVCMFPTYTSLGCCYKSLLPLKSLIFYLQLFVDIFTVLVIQLDYKQYTWNTSIVLQVDVGTTSDANSCQRYPRSPTQPSKVEHVAFKVNSYSEKCNNKTNETSSTCNQMLSVNGTTNVSEKEQSAAKHATHKPRRVKLTLFTIWSAKGCHKSVTVSNDKD